MSDCIQKISKKHAVPLLFLYMTLCWALFSKTAESGSFAGEEYRTIVYGIGRSFSTVLIGGYGDGEWHGHASLPVTVDGKSFLPPDPSHITGLPDLLPCTTPFVVPGKRFVFYSPAGKAITLLSARKTTYSVSPGSRETFIDVEFDLPLPDEGFMLGLSGEWEAMAAPTLRISEKDAILFSTESENGKTLTATFTRREDGNGYSFYSGKINAGDRDWPITDVYTDSEENITGLFIDANGSGRAEFVLYVSSAGGFVIVYEIENGEPRQVLGLDLGD